MAYGYATQVVCLNEDGTIERWLRLMTSSKAINPLSVEGQIEAAW